jgi:type II secretory pathway pseudopilin PulG
MNMRVFNRKRRQQAWTLAEVMVTVVVVAIVFVSLFAGFGYGFSTIRATREDLRATQILTQKIEGIRLCTWDQLNNQCPTNFQDTYVALGSTNSGLIYTGTMTKTANPNLPAGYRTNVLLITVTVTWKTPGAGAHDPAISHTRSMQTQSALYGLQNYLYGVTNSI